MGVVEHASDRWSSTALLKAFFDFYASSFDFADGAVSVRLGRQCSRNLGRGHAGSEDTCAQSGRLTLEDLSGVSAHDPHALSQTQWFGNWALVSELGPLHVSYPLVKRL